MRVPTEPPPPVTNLGAVTGAVDGVFIITEKEHTKIMCMFFKKLMNIQLYLRNNSINISIWKTMGNND